jgi:membrane associated rhomboid family serine protease
METQPLTCYRHPNRETRVSCPECGRGLCPDCMVYTPVGIKCADHAGVATGAARVARGARRFGVEGTGALLTKVLIGVNVGVYLLVLASGGGTLNDPTGELFVDGALIGINVDPFTGELIGVAEGQWWRLVTSMFLHGSLIHLGLNMLFLWWVAAPVEEAIGRWRFALIYFAGGLGGAAGALVFGKYGLFDTSLGTPTVGASGALFGVLGAAFLFERQRNYVLGGAALGIIVLNLALSFTLSNISVGGHIGGLVAGALAGAALSRFGQAHAAYGRPGAVGLVGVAAVMAVSVGVAYWSVAEFVA